MTPSEDPPVLAEELLGGRLALDEGDVEDALMHAARALAIAPDDDEALSFADAAIAASPDALARLELRPDVPYGIVAARARALGSRGRFAEAIDLALQVAAFRPSLPYAEWAASWAPRAKLRAADAERAIVRIGALVSALHPPLAANEARNASAALEVMAAFPPAVRSSERAAFVRVSLLRRLGRVADATRDADKAWQTHRSWLTAITRANALRDAERFEEALDMYRRAAALDPGDATAWSDMGRLLVALGRRGEAIAAYREALARDPASETVRAELSALAS